MFWQKFINMEVTHDVNNMEILKFEIILISVEGIEYFVFGAHFFIVKYHHIRICSRGDWLTIYYTLKNKTLW